MTEASLKTFKDVEREFSHRDTGAANTAERLDNKIGAVDNKIGAQDNSIDKKLDRIILQIGTMNNKIDAVGVRVDRIWYLLSAVAVVVIPTIVKIWF